MEVDEVDDCDCIHNVHNMYMMYVNSQKDQKDSASIPADYDVFGTDVHMLDRCHIELGDLD